MSGAIDTLKKQMIPLIFALNLTTWILESYFSMPIVLSWVLVGLLSAVFFMFFNLIKDRGKLSVIFYSLGAFLVLMAVQGINGAAYEMEAVPYGFWVLGIDAWEDAQSLYMVSTVVVLGMFYASSVYYFTIIRTRVLMLMVLTLIAVVIVSKVETSIIDVHFILFVLLFLLIYIAHVHREKGIKDYHNKKAYLQAVFLFAIGVVSISLIIPRPNIPLENDLIENLFAKMLYNNRMFDTSSLKEWTDVSSIYSYQSERVVFSINAKEPIYLHMQTWDHYQNNKWQLGEGQELKMHPYTESQKEYLKEINSKPYFLLSNIEKIKDVKISNKLRILLDSLSQYPLMEPKTYTANITTNQYELSAFVNPPGMIDISTNDNTKIYYDNRLTYCLPNKGRLPQDQKYQVTYFSQFLNPKERSFQFLKSLSQDNYIELLDSLLVKESNEENQRILKNYKEESLLAYKEYTNLPDTTSKRIYKLASKLTEGLESDYDKAKAIEQFFHEEGYTYDLEAPTIRGKKDYIDYFIFRSKKGVCVQFASAMVVLARASGLPARYVEGYVSVEQDKETGDYIVREKHGHAFPEVYISGYGWMVFEPTVGGTVQTDKKEEREGIGTGTGIRLWFQNGSIYLILAGCVFVGLLFFAGKSIYFKVSELVWRKQAKKKKGLYAVESIFNRLLFQLGRLHIEKIAYETPDVYARRVMREKDIDIREVAAVFNRAYYGKIEPSQEEIDRAFNKYFEVYQLVSKGIKFR